MAFLRYCEFSERSVNDSTESAAFAIESGWAPKRREGGANAVLDLVIDESRVAHKTCVPGGHADLRRAGVHPEQETLAA